MVREILRVQVGGCGNKIGNQWWQTLLNEHKLSPDDCTFIGDKNDEIDARRLDKIDVYFSQTDGKRYTPRNVSVDLDSSGLDATKISKLGSIFNSNNLLVGNDSANNNFVKGHYSYGMDYIDEIMEIIRKEIEICDCLQGFELIHSVGGGTGSGLTSLILIKLMDYYCDRIVNTTTVFPNMKMQRNDGLEFYNSILAIEKLIENCDNAFIIDNTSLFHIARNVYRAKDPTSDENMNWTIAHATSSITAPFRFKTELNSDLRKMAINLSPFPNLHFLTIAHSPLESIEKMNKLSLTLAEITDSMWSARYFLSNIKPEDGKYMSASCIWRGSNIKRYDLDDAIFKTVGCCKISDDFTTWIPNSIKSSIINVPIHVNKPQCCEIVQSGTLISNTTAVKSVFDVIVKQFDKLYKKKTSLHLYLKEGMDEMELQQSKRTVIDLITEYQDKQDACVDFDDYYMYDESADDDDDGEEDNDDDNADENQG